MDYRIVEFANRAADRAQDPQRSGQGDRQGASRGRVLPAAVVDRRKSGFGVPLARWFRANDGLGAQIAALAGQPGADVFDRAVLRRWSPSTGRARTITRSCCGPRSILSTWRDVFGC